MATHVQHPRWLFKNSSVVPGCNPIPDFGLSTQNKQLASKIPLVLLYSRVSDRPFERSHLMRRWMLACMFMGLYLCVYRFWHVLFAFEEFWIIKPNGVRVFPLIAQGEETKRHFYFRTWNARGPLQEHKYCATRIGNFVLCVCGLDPLALELDF